MVHGEEKAREMARSLLPSTRRKGARRERKHIHRAHRHHFHAELKQLAREPEDFEDRADLEDEPTREIRLMMWGRRSGDKDAPFRRWATARAQRMPRDSRLSYLRSVMPRGIIGEHALGHLERSEAFESVAQVEFDRALREDARTRNRSRPRLMERGEMAQWLRALLAAPDGHHVFNQWLRAQHREHHSTPRNHRPQVRLLLGPHDVLPFLAKLWNVRRNPPWYQDGNRSLPSVDVFLKTLKRHRGNVGAAARELGLEPRRPR